MAVEMPKDRFSLFGMWAAHSNQDMLDKFRVDRHALHYFGIVRFLDMPGYFPQLEKPWPEFKE